LRSHLICGQAVAQQGKKEGIQVAETDGANVSSIELTADIASAYVSNNKVAASELPGLIAGVFAALTSVGESEPAEPQRPAVAIKKSITPDYLICLEDGVRFKSLKRHLRAKYGLSPDDYRAKWALPKDYPMVAPAYSAARSSLAKQTGLGQGGRVAAKAASARSKAAPKARQAKT
jgi:predicted transcriptional regulator